MRQISLTLVLHDGLAPGEREDRVRASHDRVWRPLLNALTQHDGVRLAIYLSGTMTEWMDAECRESLDRLAALARREQVEIIGGSATGAALQSLPERDAAAHLQERARWAERRLGARVRGAWLGRGGWDPSLPRVLARSGVRYTFVDRALVETGGRDVDGRSPWFVSEREGSAVGILALDPRVAALVPWALPRYLANELKARALAGERYVTAAIPAELLGLRHGTGHWCWNGERSWVPSFLSLLVGKGSWLKTLLPGQAVDGHKPGGRVYPSAGTPGASGALALPVALARTWQQTRRDLDEGLDPALIGHGRWIVGPPWEAHLARRDGGNQIHKRMLRASAMVHRLRRNLRNAKGQRISGRVKAYEQASGWLHAGQGGAVLHGGIAGGGDRPGLRHAAWRALLTAEDVAREALGERDALHHKVVDMDCDGHREVVVSTPHFSVVVRPFLGGAVGELGIWRKGNLVNCLQRTEEPWHAALSLASQLPVLVKDGALRWSQPHNQAPVSVVVDDVEGSLLEQSLLDDGDLLEPVTEDTNTGVTGTGDMAGMEVIALPRPPPLPLPRGDVSAYLVQDRHHRLLFQEHFLGPGTTVENLRRDQHPQEGDFLDAPYSLLSAQLVSDDELRISMAREGIVVCDGVQRLVRVMKRLTVHRDRPRIDLRYEVANRYREPVRSRFAVELNLGWDGDESEYRFLQSGDRRSLLDRDGTWTDVTDLSLVLADVGLRAHICTPAPATLYFYRVKNLVRTCEGYDEVNQATCLVLAWKLDLWGEEKRGFDLSLDIDGA